MESDTVKVVPCCHICGYSTTHWCEKSGYEIRICKSCGFGNVFPHLSCEQIASLYSDSGHGGLSGSIDPEAVLLGEAKYPNSVVDARRISLRLKEALLHCNRPRALDVGAGYGFFTKALIAEGFDTDSIEKAGPERKVFEALVGTEPIDLMFEEFSSSTKYDAILFSQILEHAAEPREWIRKSHSLLKENGVIAIASPFFDSLFSYFMRSSEPYVIPPYHLNYFSKRAIVELLVQEGFEVLRFETVSRLPFEKISRRFCIPKIIFPSFRWAGSAVLKLIDLSGRGAMFNVYAKQVLRNHSAI